MSVSIVVSTLEHTEIMIDNIVAGHVILQNALEDVNVNKDKFEREKLYQATMHVAKHMLNQKLITAKEYKRIEDRMSEKYKPVFGSLLLI